MKSSPQKALESEAKIVSSHLLSLFAQKQTRKEYLDSVTDEIAKWTDCRCIGIRLVDADGYILYESCRGFSPKFLESENRLSIRNDVCACIRVITGEFKLADQSALTPYGSFLCENSARFVDSLTEDQKPFFRGACVEAGFNSICIVPIRYRGEILGAIHLADPREAMIPRRSVEVIEDTSLLIGEAVFRYNLEKAFDESENRYKTLIENAPLGIYLVQNGKIKFANESFATIHGYFRDEIIDIGSLNIVHPTDRPIVRELRRKRLKNDAPTEYEVRGIKKNGETIWIKRRNVRIEYNGRPSILGYETDITESKKNESTLQENHELLETIFSNLHFLVAYMNADFNFIRVNRAYAEADDHTPEFYVGKNHFALFPNPENEEIFRKVVENGRPYFVYGKPFEYAFNPERGTTYWDWGLQPIKDAGDRVAGVVLSLVNITERKRAEEELKERAAQLARLSLQLTLAEQRERWRIAGILHDHVQQLMVAAKIGQEDLIAVADNVLKPMAQRVLNQIAQSIKEMRSLSGELAPTVLNSGDLSASMEWLARWMEKNQDFEVKLESETPIVLARSDLALLLFQSIRELLLNVVKHGGVKSAQTKMECQDGHLRIVVRDQGVGFDPETILRGGGSDGKFGLFSIRERMEYLGGRCEIESFPNEGTTISLTVPLKLGDLSRETPVKPAPAATDLRNAHGKIRIMLVDDHPVMREGLSGMLDSKPGFEVVGEAGDGQEAVVLTRQLEPDVILMDINMPKMDGLEATRIIHSEFPHIRIIGLSMYEKDEQAKAMMEAGAAAYRSKSDSIDLLLHTIRDQFRQRIS